MWSGCLTAEFLPGSDGELNNAPFPRQGTSQLHLRFWVSGGLVWAVCSGWRGGRAPLVFYPVKLMAFEKLQSLLFTVSSLFN